MIRYPITLDELHAKIEAVKPGWLRRAEERTNHFRRAGRYDDPSPFWSEIKEVYRSIQHYKCAFCERRVGSRNSGKVVTDIEHFRPKSAVKAWVTDGESYPYPMGGSAAGYHLLAYHPLNYLAACADCNRIQKRSYFPVAGNHQCDADDPIAISGERPLLIYPLGNHDTDPESLIGFEGIVPQPLNSDDNSHDYHRAQVTIRLFALDVDEDLLRDRSNIIVGIWHAHQSTQSDDEKKRNLARKVLNLRIMSSAEHANLARCFLRLVETDLKRAETFTAKAVYYLESLGS